jgi:transposase
MSASKKQQRSYTPEFRRAAVEMVTVEKRKLKEAAANLGIPYYTLVAWTAQARSGEGAFRPKEQRDQAARIRELEAENRRLRIERDILKKATAFFAMEQP